MTPYGFGDDGRAWNALFPLDLEKKHVSIQ